MFKLAIIGSRTFRDYDLLKETILRYTSTFFDITIISGGAEGADSLGELFATDFRYQKQIFKPKWKKYGKSAGFIRNQTIVDNCDMVLAFWDGESRGTADIIEKAKKAKKPTFLVYY